MKVGRGEALRKIFETDKYIIIYEYYTRPPRAINSFATTLVELFASKRLHLYRFVRMGACIAIDKATKAVDAICIIYLRGSFAGLCLGRQEAIEAIRSVLNLAYFLRYREKQNNI